jgi:hypothetical protein
MAELESSVDTGKKTVSGRTIWKDTKTGEDYSERSTTVKASDGRYYTIPTVDENGNQPYSDDALSEYIDKYGPIDFLTGEELPKFKTEKEAVMYAIKRSATRKLKNMSEGGAIPMNQQTQQAFALGGFKDEGGEFDEKSGNRVPIGGTKKGVRDDIPANVSEGEFIFPEDVTRYIGLENLMNQRQEAKMGLQKMEDMGQMGNSDEAIMPDDMPFGMADLIVVGGQGEPMKFADGGFVPSYQEGGAVPISDDPVAKLPVENRTTEKLQTAYVPTFIPEEIPDYSAYMNSVTVTSKEYKNAEGETQIITFINGVPTTPIPKGYTLVVVDPADPDATTNTPAAAVVNTVNNNNDSDDQFQQPEIQQIDYDSMTPSQFAARMKYESSKTYQLGKGFGLAVASLIPFGGTLAYASMRSHARKMETTMRNLIKNAPTQALKNEYTQSLNSYLKANGLKNAADANILGRTIDGVMVDTGFTVSQSKAGGTAAAQAALTGTLGELQNIKREDATSTGFEDISRVNNLRKLRAMTNDGRRDVRFDDDLDLTKIEDAPVAAAVPAATMTEEQTRLGTNQQLPSGVPDMISGTAPKSVGYGVGQVDPALKKAADLAKSNSTVGTAAPTQQQTNAVFDPEAIVQPKVPASLTNDNLIDPGLDNIEPPSVLTTPAATKQNRTNLTPTAATTAQEMYGVGGEMRGGYNPAAVTVSTPSTQTTGSMSGLTLNQAEEIARAELANSKSNVFSMENLKGVGTDLYNNYVAGPDYKIGTVPQEDMSSVPAIRQSQVQANPVSQTALQQDTATGKFSYDKPAPAAAPAVVDPRDPYAGDIVTRDVRTDLGAGTPSFIEGISTAPIITETDDGQKFSSRISQTYDPQTAGIVGTDSVPSQTQQALGEFENLPSRMITPVAGTPTKIEPRSMYDGNMQVTPPAPKPIVQSRAQRRAAEMAQVTSLRDSLISNQAPINQKKIKDAIKDAEKTGFVGSTIGGVPVGKISTDSDPMGVMVNQNSGKVLKLRDLNSGYGQGAGDGAMTVFMDAEGQRFVKRFFGRKNVVSASGEIGGKYTGAGITADPSKGQPSKPATATAKQVVKDGVRYNKKDKDGNPPSKPADPPGNTGGFISIADMFDGGGPGESGPEEEKRGGGDGSSSRVICTELYRRGIVSTELYRMDVAYTARKLSPITVRGYHFWAIPTVRWMRSSTLLTNIFTYITIARAKEIAHIMYPNKYKKHSITGYLIKNGMESLCYLIGLVVRQKDWTVLYRGEKV